MDHETTATHEEIWDDSALVDSWNEALAEYKKYHSIHAKGGTVDDLPKDDDATRPDSNAKPETEEGGEPIAGHNKDADETAPMDEDEDDETSHPVISDAQGSGNAEKEQANELPVGDSATLGPQMLLGNIQDEELKKLLMSWYYAGYYTGLYEGKQQGLQQAEEARKGR